MSYLKKHIAVICNYQLKNNRIGSMDRFFIAFDKACKANNFHIDWFFVNSKPIEFYKNINFISDGSSNVETLFLNHINTTTFTYDYVFTHFIELFTPFYKSVKRQQDCKVFAVDHMSRPLNGFSLKKRIKIKIKYLLYSNYIDTIIAVSDYIKQQNLIDYSSRLLPKIEVIYNGIPTELYKKRITVPYQDTSAFRFIVVAHLVYEKGIQDLIFALSQMDIMDLSKIKIDIYGEGVYKETLNKLISDNKLEAYFTFKGSVSNLYELYADYDYLILPSYMEAFSLTLLESLSANVPIIATNVGGNKEIVEHGVNGFLVNVKDSASLKETIEAIISGHKSIANDVFGMIERDFYLEKMVESYIRLMYHVST